MIFRQEIGKGVAGYGESDVHPSFDRQTRALPSSTSVSIENKSHSSIRISTDMPAWRLKSRAFPADWTSDLPEPTAFYEYLSFDSRSVCGDQSKTSDYLDVMKIFH